MAKCPKCGRDAEHIMPDKNKESIFYKDAFWWLILGCVIPVIGWVIALIAYLYHATKFGEYEFCKNCKYKFTILAT